MFLTQWMCMGSTIPALQCRHFTAEKSINNLYSNSQGFPVQFLDFTLEWRKLGEVLHSKGLKSTWHSFLLISIGKKIRAFCFCVLLKPFFMEFKIYLWSLSKSRSRWSRFPFYQGVLSGSSSKAMYRLKMPSPSRCRGTGKFLGTPCSKVLLRIYRALVQAEFPGGGTPSNGIDSSEAAREGRRLLKG